MILEYPSFFSLYSIFFVQFCLLSFYFRSCCAPCRLEYKLVITNNCWRRWTRSREMVPSKSGTRKVRKPGACHRGNGYLPIPRLLLGKIQKQRLLQVCSLQVGLLLWSQKMTIKYGIWRALCSFWSRHVTRKTSTLIKKTHLGSPFE